MKVKSILVSLLIFTLMLSFALPCYAEGEMMKPSDIVPSYGNGTDANDLKTMAGKIVGLLRNAAVIIGVIILTVLGIKYMLGSAEEKAGYQKSFVPLIVGIVVVMAATQIASMIFGLLK